MWKEIAVYSWDELLSALHHQSVIPQQPKQGNHFRSPYVFRGMSVASWDMKTSLERLGSAADVVEPALIRSFRKYAPRGAFAPDSEWEALAVAQHNGLPTRVLDWSVSPLIAAHFATFERPFIKDDGVIWCVNLDLMFDKVLPKTVSKPLGPEKAKVYDVRMLEKRFGTIAAFDKLKADACIFFEPPSIDSRIANQFGILSAMNGPTKSHHKYFADKSAIVPGLVQKIVIKASAKSQIRDMLDQNNVNERMLFPGMPGLCDWLRRYYGPV